MFIHRDMPVLVGGVGRSPTSPSELMIALHNVPTSGEGGVELSAVIKAISLCFRRKTIYTQVFV